MRKCSTCKIVKPFDDFPKNKAVKNGIHYHCRPCAKIASEKWRKDNPEKAKEWRGRYYYTEKGQKFAARSYEKQKLNKEKTNQYKYSWDKRNPEKRAAYIKVRNALKKKALLKQPCLKCGSEKVEAHHEDYNRPLDVMWLCRRCHGQIHRIYKDF